jgi:hypothetical protein
VAHQLIPPSSYNLIMTGAATLAGQYIVIHNVIKNSKTIKKVVFIYYPGSFKFGYDNKYTYNNFIKPFYCRENISLFDQSTQHKLHRHKYYYLYMLPMSKVLPIFSLIDCENSESKNFITSEDYDDVINYIRLIHQLCEERKIEFIVISPPVSMTHKEQFDFVKFKKIISANNLSGVFYNYFQSLEFKDDKYYKDSWHFKDEYELEMSAYFQAKFKHFLSHSN